MILFCRQQWQKCIENWKGQKKKFTSFHVGGYIYMVKTDLNPVQGYIELFHFKLFFFFFFDLHKGGLTLEEIQWLTSCYTANMQYMASTTC